MVGTAKLIYEDGIVTLDTSEEITLMLIEYSGTVKIDDSTSSDWVMIQKQRTICIFTMSGTDTPSELFQYEGEFKIKKMDCYNRDSVKLDSTVQQPISTRIGKIKETMDSIGDPESYMDEFIVGKKQDVDSLIKENQYTRGGEYFYKDGSEYVGEYHRHGNFQAMTGATHTESSVSIYLKDGKGNIFDPNDPKMLSNFRRKAKRVLK